MGVKKGVRGKSSFILVLGIFIFLLSAMDVSAICVNLTTAVDANNNYWVNGDTVLCTDTYYLNDTDVGFNPGVLIMNASGITLDCNSSTIIGENVGYGVYSFAKSNNVIKNCEIWNYTNNIHIETNSNNNTLSNNNLTTTDSSDYPVYIDSSIENRIINNIIITTGTDGAYGIYLTTAASNTTIQNNNITTSGNAAYGIQISSSDNITATLNTITTTGANADGISITSSDNLNVNNNNVTTSAITSDGIDITSTLNSVFLSNMIITKGPSSNGVVIGGNTTNSNFSSNFINSSGSSGIGMAQDILYPTRNYIDSNEIYSDGDGINIVDGNLTITNNNITSTEGFGIDIATSNDNNLSNNKIISVNEFSIYAAPISNNGNVITSDNLAHGKPIAFYNNVSNQVLQNNNTWGELIVLQSTNVTIQNINITNADGILNGDLSNSLIDNVNILNATSDGVFSYYNAGGGSSVNNNITNSKISIFGDVDNTAAIYNFNSYNILNNIITANGSNTNSYALFSESGISASSTIDGNVITAYASINGIKTYASNLVFSNNNITTYGNAAALYLLNSNSNNISSNRLDAQASNNIYLFNVDSSTIRNNMITGGGQFGIISGSNNNQIINNTISLNRSLISSYALDIQSSTNNISDMILNVGIRSTSSTTNFTNLTINESSGSIFYDTLNLNTSTWNTQNNLNMSQNSIFLNSTALTPFNRSATLTLKNLSYQKSPTILKDSSPCISPSCNVTSYGSNVLVFNVSSFTTYTTIPNANLTIWDETDNQPYGNQIRFANNQTLFFANYTNSSNSLPITNAGCNITFDAAPTGPFNMAYNSTKALYEYNRSFTSRGSYQYNISCEETSSEPLNAADSINISNTPPEITSPALTPAAAYTNDSLTANITYTDIDLDSGTIYFNWTVNSVQVRFASSSGVSNGSSVTDTLGEGNFTKWQNVTVYIYANDSINSSSIRSASINISNTPPTIDNPLTTAVANTSSTFTYDYNATDPDVDDSMDTLIWAENTTLFNINSSTGVITDTPTESEAGIYSIKVNVTDNTNTSEDIFTYVINDTTDPRVSIQEPQAIIYNTNESIPLNYAAADGNIDSCWYNLDNSTNITLAGCQNRTFNTTIGTHTLYLFANDTYGNLNNTESVTFTVNLIPNISITNITPSPAYTNDTLSVNATYHDAENGTVYLNWTVNDVQVRYINFTNITNAQMVNDTLNSSNFNKTDNVTVYVWAYDGTNNSMTRNSSINISNTIPEITAPVFSPVSPQADQDVTASVNYTDIDIDNGTVYFRWYKNSASIYNDTYNISSGNSTSSILSSGNYSAGDNISISVFAFDGDDNSTVKNSSVIISAVPSSPSGGGGGGGSSGGGGGGGAVPVKKDEKKIKKAEKVIEPEKKGEKLTKEQIEKIKKNIDFKVDTLKGAEKKKAIQKVRKILKKKDMQEQIALKVRFTNNGDKEIKNILVDADIPLEDVYISKPRKIVPEMKLPLNTITARIPKEKIKSALTGKNIISSLKPGESIDVDLTLDVVSLKDKVNITLNYYSFGSLIESKEVSADIVPGVFSTAADINEGAIDIYAAILEKNITETKKSPDFIIRSASVTPLNEKSLEGIPLYDIDLKIKNIGNAPDISASVYYKTDKEEGEIVYSTEILSPDEELTTGRQKVPLNGSSITFYVDYNDEIEESNEANNEHTISDIKVPETVPVEENITGDIIIFNRSIDADISSPKTEEFKFDYSSGNVYEFAYYITKEVFSQNNKDLVIGRYSPLLIGVSMDMNTNENKIRKVPAAYPDPAFKYYGYLAVRTIKLPGNPEYPPTIIRIKTDKGTVDACLPKITADSNKIFYVGRDGTTYSDKKGTAAGRCGKAPIEVKADLPDFVIKDISVVYDGWSDIFKKDYINISFNISNEGSATAMPRWVYYDFDGKNPTSIWDAQTNVPAGESIAAGSNHVPVEGSVLNLYVDYKNDVEEIDETNNRYTISMEGIVPKKSSNSITGGAVKSMMKLLPESWKKNDGDYRVEMSLIKEADPGYRPSYTLKGLWDQIRHGPKEVFSEEFGPYDINRGAIFSQGYSYGPELAGKNYTLRMTLMKGGNKIKSIDRDIELK